MVIKQARRAGMGTAQRRSQRAADAAQDPYGAFLVYVQREKAHQTWRSYSRILGMFQAAFANPFSVTAEQVCDWLTRPAGDRFHSERPRAQGTKRKEHGCLKAFYRNLHEQLGVSNVMAEIRTPSKPRRLRPKKLSRQQVNEIIAAITAPQQRVITLLMADAGLRVHEACEITPSRVVLQGKRRYLMVLGKGDVERLVPIGNRLAAALAEQLERGKREGWHDEGKPLVRTATGAPYTRGQVWQFIALVGLRAGMPDVHPHRFRHSWACWLYFDRRVPLVMVSRLLGHASLTITQDYLGVRMRSCSTFSPGWGRSERSSTIGKRLASSLRKQRCAPQGASLLAT
jgi:site-specific recombinase XerD